MKTHIGHEKEASSDASFQIREPKRKHPLKTAAKVLAAILIALVLFVAGYVIYMEVNYYRIPDNQTVHATAHTKATYSQPLDTGQTYRITTYNIGFGAYTPDFTFFMDEGTMKDGTPKKGVESRAHSKESVIQCTDGDIRVLKREKPNIMLFQEVDVDSTRSYHVDQTKLIEKGFPGYQAWYTSNFHTPYLLYPFSINPLVLPHGSVSGGLLTLSDYQVTSSVRRSYPVDSSFPAKFVDLDRCFLESRIAVKGGKELVVINSHMSAYDKGGTSRVKQLKLLFSVIQAERARGNYVIVGGDFNHALSGSLKLYKSAQKVPAWVSVLKDSEMPEGFRVVAPDNLKETPTCRGDDIPYGKDYTYTVSVDGFIVSDNIEAKTHTIDSGFKYSDHNPQLMEFSLKDK